MVRYILVSVASGILFGIMDGIFNANPLAQRLYGFFEPIARKRINIAMGFIIDVVFGFALAGIFILIKGSLQFSLRILNGILYGVIVWFLRVVMPVVGQRMMFNMPKKTMIYMLSFGLIEMIVLGLVYGWIL